ncbi:MAG: hypothetical protein JNK15_10815 [Planctomycetes bacterium]|nr:hypothetical protein [Planctomycetota bacterium]
MRPFTVRHVVVAAALSLASVGASNARPQDPQPAPADGKRATGKEKSPERAQLEAIRTELERGGRAEAEAVRTRLEHLGTLRLEARDRELFLRLARDAAMRLGDRGWLAKLKDGPGSNTFEVNHAVLVAMSQMQRLDLAAAKATMAGIGDVDGLGPLEQRRAYAVRARIAQLAGDADERQWIDAMIDHLPSWPMQKCQTCHGPLHEPKAVASLPITNLWFGERYVELLRAAGDAQKVHDVAAAALKRDPTDDLERIRLAFALQALDKPDAATQRFRELPWADFPDRNLPKPRTMTTWP